MMKDNREIIIYRGYVEYKDNFYLGGGGGSVEREANTRGYFSFEKKRTCKCVLTINQVPSPEEGKRASKFNTDEKG